MGRRRRRFDRRCGLCVRGRRRGRRPRVVRGNRRGGGPCRWRMRRLGHCRRAGGGLRTARPCGGMRTGRPGGRLRGGCARRPARPKRPRGCGRSGRASRGGRRRRGSGPCRPGCADRRRHLPSGAGILRLELLDRQARHPVAELAGRAREDRVELVIRQIDGLAAVNARVTNHRHSPLPGLWRGRARKATCKLTG